MYFLNKKKSKWSYFFVIINIILSLFNIYKFIKNIFIYFPENSKLKNFEKGKNFFIFGNSPDLEIPKNIDGKNILIACNFFYKKKIKPNIKYYFIIDEKINDGTWSISMIDEIYEAFPRVSLILNYKFKKNKNILKIINNRSVIWIQPDYVVSQFFPCQTNLTKPISGFNVVKVATFFSYYLGASKITFYGTDNTGLFLNILGRQAHFYDEKEDKKNGGLPENLLMSGHGIQAWSFIKRDLKNVILKNKSKTITTPF